MHDKVLREVTVLIRDFRKCANTLWELRTALLDDKRFASVMRYEGAGDADSNVKKDGPEGLPEDPFSVPLERSHD